MLSMVIWVFALAGSIAATCIAVAFEARMLHLGATALVSFGIVAAAVFEHRSAEESGSSRYALAAMSARFMGLLWAWSGISACVTYSLILDWPHWVPVVVAMFVGCCMCLFMGLILDREAGADVPDQRAPMLVGLLSRGQFAFGAVVFGVLAAMAQTPYSWLGGANTWVAINLAMCTAAGLLTLTGYVIMQESRQGALTDITDTSSDGQSAAA
jgi:hypothetical protein